MPAARPSTERYTPGRPRLPSRLDDQLAELRRQLAHFDSLRGCRAADYAAANARVLCAVRDLLEVAYPGESENARRNQAHVLD